MLDGLVMWGGWTGGVEAKDKLVFGVIEGSHLYLPDASPIEINVSRRRLLIANDENVQLQADGSLHWDDGTVWTRCEVDYNEDMLRIAVELPSSIQRHASGKSCVEYVFSVGKDDTRSDFCEAAKRAAAKCAM